MTPGHMCDWMTPYLRMRGVEIPPINFKSWCSISFHTHWNENEDRIGPLALIEVAFVVKIVKITLCNIIVIVHYAQWFHKRRCHILFIDCVTAIMSGVIFTAHQKSICLELGKIANRKIGCHEFPIAISVARLYHFRLPLNAENMIVMCAAEAQIYLCYILYIRL